MEKFNIKIGGQSYLVQVAKTEEEKARGLMEVTALDSSEGMLFDYTDEKETELSFWMKDTYIPLDIVFINNQNKVVAVEHGEPESDELITCVADENEFLYYVLEVNANSGIKIGDTFEFDEDALDDLEDVSDEEIKMFILNSEGAPVHEIEGGVRIFSRIHTRELIRLVKQANKTKTDKDYRRLSKKLFKILTIQDTQEPEFVDSPDSTDSNTETNA